jgi:hypothetical protein
MPPRYACSDTLSCVDMLIAGAHWCLLRVLIPLHDPRRQLQLDARGQVKFVQHVLHVVVAPVQQRPGCVVNQVTNPVRCPVSTGTDRGHRC